MPQGKGECFAGRPGSRGNAGDMQDWGRIMIRNGEAGNRRTETLDYMQSMLGQLRTMALAERCDMLGYFIEMAYVEVSDILRGERPLRSGMPSDQDKRHSAA